jgi:hypothetical protein
MTSLHGAIRTLLYNDTAVRAIVDSRIYPLNMPLNATFPALTIHKISGGENHVTGHGYPRYQVSCWAESFEGVQTLADAVTSCLNRYKGVASGNHIKRIVYVNSLDAIEDETGLYHVPVDFKVIHFPP